MAKARILYVEDDTEVRENYTLILDTYFGNVLSTGCGEEALELYKKNDFDLLILDINLPKMTGLELAHYIRKKDNNTKIIMLTAYSDRDRLLQAVNLKLESYLIKPVDSKTFVETVRTFIKKDSIADVEKNSIELFDKLLWDKEKQSLSFEEKNVKLTKKEIVLMSMLVKNINSFLDKDAIIQKVWEDEFTDFSHNQKLTQLVYRLNKKVMSLTKIEKPLISNTYSVGYKLETSSK